MPAHETSPSTARNQAANPNLMAWLRLARAGLATFPVGPDKRPLLRDWQGKATTDTAQIRRWAARWPDAMPALPTGTMNGVSVLDLDLRDDGRDGIKAAADLGLDVSRTFTVRTPSGGLHAYYRHRDGVTNASAHLPAGVDVRGAGGFVIAPGAVLPDGRSYRLRGEADLADLELLRRWPADLMPPPRVEREDTTRDHDKLSADDVRAIHAELAEAPRMANGDRPWIEDRSGNLKVGMATHHWSGGSAEGFALWREHAEKSTRYKGARNLRQQWESFRDKPDGVTMGSLIIAAPEWCEARHAAEIDAMFLDDPDGEDNIAEDAAPDGFFKPASDWADKPVPKRRWLVRDLIPMGQPTLLTGDGGVGKSLLAIQLAVAVATGGEWIGQRIEEPGKVLLLGAEDDDDEMHRRVHDVCKAQRVSMADLHNLRKRSLAGEDAVLAAPSAATGRLTATALYKRITKIVEAEKPRLIVLDTLADLFGGNENDRVQARTFVGMLRAWSIRHNCAVVLLAHPSKAGIASGSGDSGSTAWHGSVRSRLYLDTVKVDGVEADTSVRVLRTMKANYGPRGGDMRLVWKEGCFIADDEFDAAEREEFAEDVFLDCLDTTTKQGRSVSPNRSSSFAPAVFARMPTSCGLSKKEFESAMERLLNRGKIVVTEHGRPSQRRAHLERSNAK